MKKIVLVIFAILVLASPNFAQFTSVTYDANKNWFNEGQALPAEKAMVFKGVLPEDVERIEVQILSSKNNNQLYQVAGKRQSNNEFSLPVSYKLRAGEQYDFRIDFFQLLSAAKQNALFEEINATLDTYLDVNLSGDKDIKLLKNSDKTVKAMNGIMSAILSRYRSKIAEWQPEFSEVIRLKLEQMDKVDLGKGYVKGDTSTTPQIVRQNVRQQLVAELKSQVEREIKQMLHVELLELSETQVVNNYPTESKESGLSLNVGYGGVYLSGKWQNFTYGASPYVGLAFPLGNSVLGSKFLSNSSVTIGFFLENFEDENEKEVTGFLVNRPIYLGLDHKLFKFIRVNGGATFLEKVQPGSVDSDSGKKVMIRPFIGLSARIDLSIGLGE